MPCDPLAVLRNKTVTEKKITYNYQIKYWRMISALQDSKAMVLEKADFMWSTQKWFYRNIYSMVYEYFSSVCLLVKKPDNQANLCGPDHTGTEQQVVQQQLTIG